MFELIKRIDKVRAAPSSVLFVEGRILFIVRDAIDSIQIFDLTRREIVMKKEFDKIDYFEFIYHLLVVSDIGNEILLLLDIDTFQQIDSIHGKYYCGRNVRSGDSLFCAIKEGNVKRVGLLNFSNRKINCVYLPVKQLPALVYGEFFFDFYGSVFFCGKSTSGEVIWSLDVSTLAPSAEIANRSYWVCDNMVIIQTISHPGDGNAYPSLLIWMDIHTGTILHRRDDGVHLMQRIENDIFILVRPFNEDGRLKIISLADASTKLDLSVYDLFAPFAHLNRSVDNFQYVKRNSILYILHFDSRTITVFNLENRLILQHFRVDTSEPFLKSLEVHDRWLFALDAKDTLHIYERQTAI